jgi:hypothetical protein
MLVALPDLTQDTAGELTDHDRTSIVHACVSNDKHKSVIAGTSGQALHVLSELKQQLEEVWSD